MAARAFLAVLVVLSWGCSRPSYSVLLVTLDTTRADALGAYGNRSGITPHLDRLAIEGVVYERAFTVAPLTLPAHASMFTGLAPPRHGVRDNGLGALPPSATTLAERARDEGYQTAAFLGSVVLDQGFGLEQGFERYEAPARVFWRKGMGYAERSAGEVADLAIEWLRSRDPARPFLLWAHLWDAHAPYEPPAEFLQRAGGNPYLGEVSAADHALGRILDELERSGALADTFVIAVSDHGEAFMEHDEFSHGAFVWNTTLRVPLIVRRPDGEDAGLRVRAITSVVDVFPTVLHAMGLEADEDGLDGQDLLEDEPGEERGAYFESYYGYFGYGWHPLAGWLDRRGKYIHSCEPLYFDLESDPEEGRDLSRERGKELEPYRQALVAVERAPALAPAVEDPLDPVLRSSLQALGYAALAGSRVEMPAPLAVLERPSPHARAKEQLEVQEGEGLLANERYAEAEAQFSSIVSDNPGNLFAWDRLALCRMRSGRHAAAIEPLEHVLAEGPGHAESWVYLGTCLLVTGDHERSLAAFARALEIDRNHPQALGGIVNALEEAGLAAQAAPFRERFEAVQGRP